MFCTYCGGEIREGSEFCTKCGSKVAPEYIPQPEQSPEVNLNKAQYAEPVLIRCVRCNEIIGDEEHRVNNCPYCGAAQSLNIAVDPNSGCTGRTALTENHSGSGFTGIPASPDIYSGRKKRRKGLIIAAVCAAVIAVSSIVTVIANVAGTLSREEIIWPSSGLSQMIPEMSGVGEIYSDGSDDFSVELYNISKADFAEYAQRCKESGFDIDAVKNTYSFYAYNSEGYKLSLDYYDYDNELTIRIAAPLAMRKIFLASTGLGGLLPGLPSDMGYIESESDDYLTFYLGDVTRESFDEFVTACISEGFNNDYSRSGDYFSGENDDGVSLYVQYLGNNTIEVILSD